MAKVEDGSIESFRPQRRNLNRHSQRGMGALEASMRKHGYVAPMTAAASGEIIDGSARLETVANVFDDDVLIVHHDGTRPVVMVRDDIPDATTNEARAISALANRVAEINLEWDAAELLADLQSGVDFGDVFNQDELDELLADLVAPEPVEDTPPDVSKADELQKKWQTASGQLWSLGKHRLIIGDCTDKATVERLMGGEKASMMWTDPPYGVDYVGKTRNALTIENDVSDDLVGLLDGAFGAADEVLNPGAVYYIAHPDIFAYEFVGAIRKRKWVQARPPVVLWVKDSFVMGRGDYHSRSESLLYGWKAGAAHHAVTDRTQDNVWEIPRPKASEEHPTMKPVELVCRSLRNSTSTHDIVYEPFSGSGTTIIACQSLSRQCRAIELDAGYVAITLQRFQDATGQTPVLIDS